MAEYLVTDTELEATADAIRAKTGSAAAIEWEQDDGFANAIDAIPSGGGGGGAITITDTPNAEGGVTREITAVDISNDTVTAATLASGVTAHDKDGNALTGTAQLAKPEQSKSATPSETAQTITPDAGYVLDEVTVGAIPANYVGSGVTRRDSDDLTASGATVTAPAGYYENAASKAVASGTEGTPTASKGAVNNHAITVTPSVTNGAGYIAGGEHTGNGVSVAASELVSGTLNISQNGETDVTNYQKVNVAVSGGKNVQAYRGYDTVNATSYTDTDVTITVAKTGTYNISWLGWRNTNTGTSGSQLYKNGTAVGTANTSFINTYGHSVSLNSQSLQKDDVLVVRARARNTSYIMAVGNLIIEEV